MRLAVFVTGIKTLVMPHQLFDRVKRLLCQGNPLRPLQQTTGNGQARAMESELIQSAIRINPTLVLIGIMGFVASFAFSLGPVMWVMLPEIFPNQVRGVAMAITGTLNSAVSFGVQFIFPWQLNNFGAASTFLGYAIFAALFLLLTLWLIPETKNKTLEELELELTGN